MALIAQSYVEPLLSKRQQQVVRNIACAAQLNEALILFEKTFANNCSANVKGFEPIHKAQQEKRKQLSEWLKAEIMRHLMQIKTPDVSVANKAKAPKAAS